MSLQLGFVKTVRKVKLSVLILLASFLFASGQDKCEGSVEGLILDLETSEPIAYATVKTQFGGGTLTDDLGRFLIKGLCDGELNLEISHVGYKPITHHHDPHHGSPTILLAPNHQILKSVVVEGKYNPSDIESLKVTSIDHATMDRHEGSDLASLVGSIAGVSMISTGQNVQKPIIHGLHSNRILIINDDIRHEFQNWGSGHAPEIDPSQAEQISVVKGASTVRYGPDALAGVIIIEPFNPILSSNHEGSATLGTSSNGRALDGGIKYRKGWRKTAFAWSSSGQIQGDLQASSYNLTNTGKKQNSYRAAWLYHASSLTLLATYSRLYQEIGILRGSVTGSLNDLAMAIDQTNPSFTSGFSYIIGNPRQEIVHQKAKIEASIDQPTYQINLQYAYQHNHRQEFDVRRGSLNSRPAINLTLVTHNLDLSFHHPKTNHTNGSIGLQGQVQDNNNIPGTNTFPFIPNYNTYRIGAYIIEATQLGKLTIEGGLRYDYQYVSVRERDSSSRVVSYRLPFSQVTGSLGAIYNMHPHWTWQSNLGMAWRPPSISELFSYGTHQSSLESGLWRDAARGDFFDTNRKAIPEVGYKWISTLTRRTEKNESELILHANIIDNYIYARPAGITVTGRGPFPYFQYTQTTALIAGMDVAHTESWESWEFTFKSSYIWAKDVRNDDDFIEIPPLQLEAKASWWPAGLKRWDVEAFIEPSYTFRYWQQPRTISPGEIIDAKTSGTPLFAFQSSFDFMQAPPGAFLMEVGTSMTLKKLHLHFMVENLLNTQYRLNTDRLRYYADQTGRNVKLILKYEF